MASILRSKLREVRSKEKKEGIEGEGGRVKELRWVKKEVMMIKNNRSSPS